MKSSLLKLPLTLLAILLSLGMSIVLHSYKIDRLCLNEDEAAQGYNTYAVMQTGYDEYGRVPLRYLSFGENKLPLTGILSAPLITFFGLNDLTVRLPVLLIGTIFPLLFYGAAYALSRSKRVAIVACLLASTNIWLYTMSRHQHEAVVLAAIVLLIIALLYRYIGDAKTTERRNQVVFGIPKTVVHLTILLFMGLYTYHSGKVIMPFLAFVSLLLIWKHKRTRFITATILILIAFLLFTITEIIHPTNRVSSLSYFTAPVFTHEIQEGRRLGGSPLYFNKVVYGTHRAIQRTLGYLSPQFLLFSSDPNPRYGSPQVHLLTMFEYALFIVGMILMWWKRHPSRLLLTSLLLITIVPAAAALPTDSLTRSFIMTVPLILIASLGANYLWDFGQSRDPVMRSGAVILLLVGTCVHIFGFYTSSRAYFHQYLESPQTQKAWQCGTKELAEYVWKNYTRFDSFFITRTYGQPYIFLLFYKPYPAREYQRIAKPGQYNEYGFWEQDGFDKFIFRKPLIPNKKSKSAFIMTPEEAAMNTLDSRTLKPILHDGQVRFYIKENL